MLTTTILKMIIEMMASWDDGNGYNEDEDKEYEDDKDYEDDGGDGDDDGEWW